jgi:iron-sulfur cluster insertion protein
MITITENTVAKVTELLQEQDPGHNLRIFVQGGGCSGMSYGFTWETETAEDDFVIEAGNLKFVVDSMSMQYLTGAAIDYTETIQGSQFSIKNPNAQTTCGCGSSFSV